MTTLYRYFDSHDRLLYIGLTNPNSKRDEQHRRDSRWHGYAVRHTYQDFPNRAVCRTAEADAIKREQPIFNLRHRYKSHAAWYVAITEYENNATEDEVA